MAAPSQVAVNTIIVGDWVCRPRNGTGQQDPTDWYWDEVTAVVVGATRVTLTTASQDDGDDAVWGVSQVVMRQQ